MKFGLFLLFAFCCCAVQAQTAPTNSASTHTGVITGRVLADNGQPLPGVAVMADSAQLRSAGARSATTNENGDFRLTGLALAAYSLRAALPAYVMLPLTGVMGEPKFFHAGDSATITMAKGGVTGRVTNANSEPIPGLSIKAIRLRDIVGQPISNASFARRTDDRGLYRIFGLPSGTYIVGTDGANAGWSHNADEQAEDAPTYHPSSTRDTALELTVQTGLELTGIDLRYRGERGRTVSGKFFDSGNTGVVNIELRRPGGGERVVVTWQSINRTQPNQPIGFELRGVADGEYDLVAERLGGEDDGSASAPRHLTVNGADVSGIELRLTPFASVTGKLALIETPTENKAACQNNRQAFFEEVAIFLWPEAKLPQAARTAFPHAVRRFHHSLSTWAKVMR
jgi:hypothetical protein